MLPLIAKKRVNVETADLPGPPAPLYFCGAQLLEVFPLLNLIGNVSLGVGALSYAGQFNIMAVGDADAYPDIEVFTASARNELHSLAGARKPVTQRSEWLGPTNSFHRSPPAGQRSPPHLRPRQ